jgi:hypothetical protein
LLICGNGGTIAISIWCDIDGGRAFEGGGFSFGLLARHCLSMRIEEA